MAIVTRDQGQAKAKNNAFRLAECTEMLRKLAATLCAPGFDGKITIELSAKDGYFGRPKQSIESWGAVHAAQD